VPDTFRYSQDLMAKKKAPMKRSHIAFSNFVVAIWWNFLSIEPVIAACCFIGLSLFA
jgi:hypothetical protein